jgi:hypothetical protein
MREKREAKLTNALGTKFVALPSEAFKSFTDQLSLRCGQYVGEEE